MAVDEVAELVAHHETQLGPLERLEQRRAEHDEEPPLLGLHACCVEVRRGVDVGLERDLDAENLAAVLGERRERGRHRLGESERGGEQLSADPQGPSSFMLLELSRGALDERVLAQLVEERGVAL